MNSIPGPRKLQKQLEAKVFYFWPDLELGAISFSFSKRGTKGCALTKGDTYAW